MKLYELARAKQRISKPFNGHSSKKKKPFNGRFVTAHTPHCAC